MSAAASSYVEGHWAAGLRLRFVRSGDRTRVAEARHYGPLRVQRALYPEGPETAQVIVLHPPGGVVGGDALRVHIRVEAGAHAIVTTPAATKLYRSDGRIARVETTCEVADGGCLEHLPQETIAFGGARATVATRVSLEGDARFLGWEQLTLGRPACDEPFDAGLVEQVFEIVRDGAPLLTERTRHVGGDPALSAPWGLGGRASVGALVATDADRCAPVEALARQLGADMGLGRVGDLIALRALAHEARELGACLEDVWAKLRPALWGRAATAPRIWRT